MFISLLEEPSRKSEQIEMSLQNIQETLKLSDQTNKFGYIMVEIIDFLDPLLVDTLDEIWKSSYETSVIPFPQDRMFHLFEAMCYWIVQTIQAHLGYRKSSDLSKSILFPLVWLLPFDEVSYLIF